MNEISTEDFKEIVLENKQYIIGIKIRVGKSIWKFAGAGDEKLMFRSKKSGIDTTQASEGKFWVKYKNLNPLVKGILLSEIQKAIMKNQEAKNHLNGTDEVSKNVSIKRNYDKLREEIGGKRLASQKTAKELGFIPGNEIDLY